MVLLDMFEILTQKNKSIKECSLMHELDTYVDAKTLSKSLGLSRTGVFNLARQGILPRGLKLGHSRRWKLSEVKAALANATT